MKEKLRKLKVLHALLISAPKDTAFASDVELLAMRVQADIDSYEEMVQRDESEVSVKIAFQDAALQD